MTRMQCLMLVALGLVVGSTMAGADDAAPRMRVFFVVDEAVYPEIKTGLDTYVDHVRRILPVDFKPLVAGFYKMDPPAIRALLKTEYDASDVPVVGAIMIGPIPHAVRGIPRPPHILTPVPYYYEDFDSEWFDDRNNGYFDRVVTDRSSNPTEIWTAWWVPPSNEPAEQVAMLKGFLKKLDRYHRGELDGRDGMIFIAGNGNSVEITEAWTVLMGDALRSTGQRVAKVYSVDGEMSFAVHPDPGPEFKPTDLENALQNGRYQHVHLLTHGAPDGFYWEQAAVRGTQLNFDKFDQTGANILTTSGCSNGNFRGANRGDANYARSIGNLLVFSPNTITVAYYGATSPQSTGVFAVAHTPLYEYLDPENGSYFGDAYYRLRNSDVCWGTNHYMFRGADGKAIFGDPFARYHKVENR